MLTVSIGALFSRFRVIGDAGRPGWIDYNGHLTWPITMYCSTRSRRGLRADRLRRRLRQTPAVISCFTAEVHVRYLRELSAGDRCASPPAARV